MEFSGFFPCDEKRLLTNANQQRLAAAGYRRVVHDVRAVRDLPQPRRYLVCQCPQEEREVLRAPGQTVRYGKHPSHLPPPCMHCGAQAGAIISAPFGRWEALCGACKQEVDARAYLPESLLAK